MSSGRAAIRGQLAFDDGLDCVCESETATPMKTRNYLDARLPPHAIIAKQQLPARDARGFSRAAMTRGWLVGRFTR